MTVTLDPYTIPTKGKVEIQIERSFEIKITAEEARKQVNRWLLNEVSYLMHSLPPYQPKQAVPSQYLAKNVPSAPTITPS